MRRGLAATAAIFATAAAAAFAVAGGRAPEVELSEFRVAAPHTLQAGETELVVRNTGRVEHDLVVVRTDRAAGDLPVGLNGVAPQLAGRIVFGEPHSAHEHGGPPRHHYAPGSAKRSALGLAPGRYVLLCSLPGHYEQGQRAPLVVRGG